MRHIIIKREKCKLFAIWSNYWCVLNFAADKIPPLCTKKIDCQDCDEYCERISSHKGQLFVESSDNAGNRKIVESIQAIPIKNGKTLEIEINNQEHGMFILFESGLIISNEITIPAGCSDVSYSIKTNGGILKNAEIAVCRAE